MIYRERPGDDTRRKRPARRQAAARKLGAALACDCDNVAGITADGQVYLGDGKALLESLERC